MYVSFLSFFSIDREVILDCGNSANSCPDTSITLTCKIPHVPEGLLWYLPRDKNINRFVFILFLSVWDPTGTVDKKTVLGTEFVGVLVSKDEDSIVSTLTFNSSLPSGSEILCNGAVIDDTKSCVVSAQSIAEQV